MTRLLLTFFTCLLLFQIAGARNWDRKPQESSATNSQQNLTTGQGAELQEAKQLNSTIIKLYNEGRYDEALPLAKRALQIREKILGPDNQLIVGDLINLAELHIAKEKYGSGQELLERVVKIYEAALGPDNPKISDILDRLALTNFARGYSEKTEKLYLRALSIREKSYGEESAEAGKSLARLAEYYLLKGLYKKAEDVYKRLLPIREKKAGPNNEALIETLERYACLLRKAKRQDEASQLEIRASSLAQIDLSNAPSTDSGIVTGKAIELPKPSYPPEAKASRIRGTVTVRVVIDERGRVIRACSISGPPELQRASEAAAYRARFTPTVISGVAVKVTGIVTYNYVL
jgi:TonB family protein